MRGGDDERDCEASARRTLCESSFFHFIVSEIRMFALRVAAWAAFGFAALAAVLFINEGFTPYLGAALSLALAGTLLLAADRALVLLAGIRDALIAKDDRVQQAPGAVVLPITPRSAEAISGDIERLKGRS
jgi:hypothetical protein